MAINLTGAKIFTGGLYSTDVGGQTGELLFSGGIWEGCVAAAAATIIAYAMKLYELKVKDAQFFPP